MNKITRCLTVFLVSILTAITPLPSVAAKLCHSSDVVFAYFNGVQTTRGEANRALNEFRYMHGDSSTNGSRVRYEVLYNYSDGFDDFVETFEQRVLEQEAILNGRYELALEIINGGGPWWERLSQLASNTVQIREDFMDWYRARIVNSLTSLLGNPPTLENYAEHRSRLDTWILEGRQILMVAHSQGNLFANSAFSYATGKVEPQALNIVHIAPASPIVNGPHRLADKDLVINGLRAVGTVPANTNVIPGYLIRPSGLNSQKDLLGHGLLEIYLNPKIALGVDTVSNIEGQLTKLQPPISGPQAETGLFTATLTWNGSGDADLHVYEPGGSHVFFRDKRGQSGYLDVDATMADGPEHYFASCNSNSLTEGIYQVGVANFSRADGRTGVVQIASHQDGVLGTRSATFGASTGDSPSQILFDVEVYEDSGTGNLEVRLP